MVVEQVAQVVFLLVPDRLIERERLAAHLQRPLRVGDRQAALRAISSTRRLAALGVDEAAGHVADLAHLLDHVHGHADRAALVGNRPADRLADPPSGIGREAEAAGVLELVDRPHQARCFPPGSGRGSSGRGCGSAWRWRRPGGDCRPPVPAGRPRAPSGGRRCGRACGGGSWGVQHLARAPPDSSGRP